VHYDADVYGAFNLEQAEKAETHVVVAAVPGIDVSHYQPAIDWETLVRAGFQYCFIKATEGSASVDKSFARHWPDARKAGLIRGAYHFFRPAVPVASQAALFLRTISGSSLAISRPFSISKPRKSGPTYFRKSALRLPLVG
jgi:GH25 family lysozyme M1 (1,4-beta-N-acetylmuramidase)